MTTVDEIMREVQRLPEPLAREVLDFIGHLERHVLDRAVAGLCRSIGHDRG